MTASAYRGLFFLASLVMMIVGGFTTDFGFEAGGISIVVAGVIIFLGLIGSSQDEPDGPRP